MNNKLIQYLKLHIISLEQDLDGETNDYKISYIQGAIDAIEHILDMAQNDMVEYAS